MISSQISACRKTAAIWTELARTGTDCKSRTVLELFPDEYFNHHCPCCEFAGCYKGIHRVRCDKCPMYGFWKLVKKGEYYCEGTRFEGEYDCWNSAVDQTERKYFAAKIRDLALEALDYWTAMRDMNKTY